MDTNNIPPANPDANREAQLADGILDRDHGEDYNPNQESVVEAHRARFDANNAQLREERDQLENQYDPVLDKIAAEATIAATDPDHQAVLPHQAKHLEEDDVAVRAGKEVAEPVPPHLHDGSSAPQPQRESKDVLHPRGPAIPVQNNSLRKDG